MRIVFLSWRDVAHPLAGGSELVLDRLASGLVARGHEVLMLHGGPPAPHEYPSHKIGGTYTQYVRAPIAFHRRTDRADVVVDVEAGIPYFSPWWQRAPVVCLVHHIHTAQWGMQFPRPVAAFGRWLEGSVMPRVYRRARFVAVSESTRHELENLGVPPQNIRTIEMGCDPIPTTGARSSTPRFLVLGRLVPHKRVEIALRLWPEVRARTGGTLVIVGDGPERARLEALAGDDVVFTGAVSRAGLGRELGAAWVLVHPAHHEGWGTVVMEAASAGIPTVAFDVLGMRDSVVDGTTGILASNDDAFADAWCRLGRDDALRSRMGEAARIRALGFTWERAVEQFEAALDDAITS